VLDDEVIRTAVLRLSRPHPSGGRVIERAAVLAAGPNAAAILTWVVDHGDPEALTPITSGQGLHGAHMSSSTGADLRKPLRYVVSATALST
jgi:hypothetical protein